MVANCAKASLSKPQATPAKIQKVKQPKKAPAKCRTPEKRNENQPSMEEADDPEANEKRPKVP